MESLKSIIVEDEKNGQEALVALLEMYCPQVEVVGIAACITSAYELIKMHNPDLVFLDIILDKENSFDLLKLLDPIQFQIIFTTSSAGYALKAFNAHAVDYLMKPISPSGLVVAIKKAQSLINAAPLRAQVTDLLETIANQEIKRITIPTRHDGVNVVGIEDIIYIKGSGSYSTFHLTDRDKITTSNNLGFYQSFLPSNTFNRSHQSYLVNIKHIKRVMPREGIIELLSGDEIPLSRNQRDGLMEQLGIGK